jgi:hypothetical protein
MLNEFVPYEIALELIELGFDESCLAFYNGKFLEPINYDFDDCLKKDIGRCYVAPLYQQAFKFLREKLNMFLVIDRHYKDGKYKYIYYIYDGTTKVHSCKYDTFDKAQYHCLHHAINNYKDYEEHKRINKINIQDAEN